MRLMSLMRLVAPDVVDDVDYFDDVCGTFFIKVVKTGAWLSLPQPFRNPDTQKFIW